MGRIAVVLGYSDRHRGGLHPICAARLERALTAGIDTVVVSGTADETALMLAACDGATCHVAADARAARTAGSAANARALARELGADEVVVVTSWWHRPRAALLFRALLLGSGVRVSSLPARGPWAVRHLLRELACFPLVPLQVAAAWFSMRRKRDHRGAREERQPRGDRLAGAAPQAESHDGHADQVPGHHDRELSGEQPSRTERSGIEPGSGATEEIPVSPERVGE